MRTRQSKEKQRDLHPIEQSVIRFCSILDGMDTSSFSITQLLNYLSQFLFVTPICAACGTSQWTAFTLELGDGVSEQYSDEDSQLDFAHDIPRSENGVWKAYNLTPMHHRCNQEMNRSNLAAFCKKRRTPLSAQQIRNNNQTAQRLRDLIISGQVMHEPTLKIAAQILQSGVAQRIGQDWKDKIMRAA